MTYSTPFYLPEAPKQRIDGRDVPLAGYVVVGSDANGVYCHGEPGTTPPKGSKVLADGKSPWTWNQIGEQFQLDAVELTPHSWAGEFTGKDLVLTRFTKEAARRTAEITKTRE